MKLQTRKLLKMDEIIEIYNEYQSRKLAKRMPINELFETNKRNDMKRVILILTILALILIGCSRYNCPAYDSGKIVYNKHMRK